MLAILVALGLVFDPRYKDFPFAPLTAAVGSVSRAVVFRRAPRRTARAWRSMSPPATLALSLVYIAFNESFANWQALWVCALFAALAVTLSAGAGPREAEDQEADGERRQLDIIEHDPEAARDQRDAEQRDRRPDQVEHGRAERHDPEHAVLEQREHDLAGEAQPGRASPPRRQG